MTRETECEIMNKETMGSAQWGQTKKTCFFNLRTRRKTLFMVIGRVLKPIAGGKTKT